jgi:hypothetical protein
MLIIVALSASTALPATNQLPLSVLTLRVVDQFGSPLADASVSINSYNLNRVVQGLSDSAGVFTNADQVAGGVSCCVHKQGYYDSHGDIWAGPADWTELPPTNLVVALKRKLAPAPLRFKYINGLALPSLTTPVAFDFEAGDWVAPNGKGKTQDAWVTGLHRQSSPEDYDTSVTIVFSNSLDGIQDFTAVRPQDQRLTSDLMPPQVAPETGYSNTACFFNSWRPNSVPRTSNTPDRNHIFRVRTHTGGSTTSMTANVGWTMGSIRVGASPDGKVSLKFSYYFNPDPTSRSLEPLDADKSKYR